MMVKTDDDDNNNNNNCLIKDLIRNIMCTIQNPSSHTEEVSGIMKQMWVELLTVELSLS